MLSVLNSHMSSGLICLSILFSSLFRFFVLVKIPFFDWHPPFSASSSSSGRPFRSSSPLPYLDPEELSVRVANFLNNSLTLQNESHCCLHCTRPFPKKGDAKRHVTTHMGEDMLKDIDAFIQNNSNRDRNCLLYTSPSPRDS